MHRILPAFAASLIAATGALAQTNHRPTIGWIPDQRITSGGFAAQNFAVADAETSAGSLTITKASSNTTWLPTANITVTNTAGAGTVSFTTPSSNGSSTVTLTVSDGAKTTATSFVLQKASSVSGNTAPVIQGVPHETIAVDSSYGTLPLVVKDTESSESALTLSAASSNPTLVPAANVVFGGQNWGRNVTVTPAANQTGRATITLTVSDGTNTRSTSFVLDVVSGNTPPSLSSLPTFHVADLGATPVAIDFTVGDNETPTADLRVTATSSSTSIVPNANIALGGSGATRTVTLTPASGATGATTITLALGDGDFTRRYRFLYVVVDPAAANLQFARSSGVFILDSAGGTSYTTTFGKAIQLRDGNIRSGSHLTGFTLRVAWDDVESSTTPGAYDFHLVENLLDQLPAGQRLSLIVTPDEPAYIATTSGVTTWNDAGTTRPVPWDPYLRARRRALYEAMADHLINGTPLSGEPRLDVLDPYLPGAHTGIRDPNSTPLRNLPGYSRANLLATVQDELRALQDNFPGKLVQLGFWKVTDLEDANYGNTPAWEYLRQQLLAEFDGVTRPRVGFFMENLAAKRTGPDVDPWSATPITSYGQALYDSRHATFNAFQMLGSWSRPFNDGHVNNTLNGTAYDAIEYAYNTYASHYTEVYIGDIDSTFFTPVLQGWHDFLQTLAITDTPASLAAAPASSTQLDLAWRLAFGATSYELQRRIGAGSYSTVYTGASPGFGDTGLAAATAHTYRVRATGPAGTSAWSAEISATTLAATTFVSLASEDGYTTGTSSATAGASDGNAIRAGENAGSSQFKGFLSFDTSALPDSAAIVSAKLRLKQGGETGTPFTTLGACTVDIKSGFFGAAAGLAGADATASASASNVGTVADNTNGNWTEIALSPAALSHLNKTGKTQFRLQFPASSATNHYVGFHSGNSAAGDRPELVVEY